MTEWVVISGKGGTGKTSLTASFAHLARDAVMADCDVDAANLHLLLAPEVLERHPFVGGHVAVIRQEDCLRCGGCLAWCRFGAVLREGDAAGEATFTIDPLACEGCRLCVAKCPVEAIDFVEQVAGEWMISSTATGPMVHARLMPAGESSGRLVTIVREQARALAEAEGRSLVLVDGPPGIGCPVIASVTGADGVLVVTEPTPAGEHDLERVLALTRHFGLRAAVCVNKWDLNPELTERIEQRAGELGARVVGRVPYDPAFTQALVAGRVIVDSLGPAADAVRAVWASSALCEEQADE